MIKPTEKIINIVLNKFIKDISKLETTIKHNLIQEIIEEYTAKNNLFKVITSIQEIFRKHNIILNKKTCNRITWSIRNCCEINDLFYDLKQNSLLQDKIELDIGKLEITLKIHDYFIIRTNPKGTFINNKFFYFIDDQDIIESYNDFATSDSIYVQFKKRRFLPTLFNPYKYFIIYSNHKNQKVKKLINNKKIDFIFDKDQLLYK